VHADRPCRAIERAQEYGIPTWVQSPKADGYLTNTLEKLEQARIDRIFLLGYMRVLNADFLAAVSRPVLNLHPSLLPAYRGLRAIERAYEAGEPWVGVSIHEVTAELDAGPLVAQAKIERNAQESLDSLILRVHELEYALVREYLLSLESRIGLE
jgi:phosphoribosylglycinamide formyltransferase-1